MDRSKENGITMETAHGLEIAATEFAQQLGLLSQRLGASAAAQRACMRSAHALIRAQGRGDVCILVETLLGGEFKTGNALRSALSESPLVCDGRDEDARLRPLVLDTDGRLYLARAYASERRVAQGLYALMHSNRLTLISGGPGAGKTTTMMKMLAAAFEQTPTLRVALTAPTGKAAQRMLEALAARAAGLPHARAQHLPRQTFTLHRLLGAHAVLPYAWVIVDEASMLDTALAAQLLGALAPQSRLILLGDPHQLAAVEAGAVLAELVELAGACAAQTSTAPCEERLDRSTGGPAARSNIRHGAAAHSHLLENVLNRCMLQLKHNYRFGAESVIGRLAQAVCAGRAADALAMLPSPQAAEISAWPNTSSFLWTEVAETFSKPALAYLVAGFEPYLAALAEILRAGSTPDPAPLLNALHHYRILAAVRAGPRGVDALNTLLEAHVRMRVRPSELPADEVWFAGRPVIVTRNDYTLGLFNGDTGIALPTPHGLRVFFQTPNGNVRAFAPVVLPSYETAFALTVHKSQGAEFDRIALILPASAGPFSVSARPLTRELVYTALTRARQAVAIFGAPEILTQAIETPTMRIQGLAARLREVSESLRNPPDEPFP